MNKIFNEQEIEASINNTLEKYYNATLQNATYNQIYESIAKIIVDMLLKKKEVFNQKKSKMKAKTVYYLCMEILLGRSLKNNLFNLGLDKIVGKVLENENIKIKDIYEIESDAGLGNGGLGRLAACFMDSLATLSYPSICHCIRYEYGLFKQKIVDGEQTELPDTWLPNGKIWLQDRQDKACIVRFGGTVKETFNESGILMPVYYDYVEVEAYPYDMLISGYDSDCVSTLRLWQAKSLQKFDMKMFNQGDYAKAVAEEAEIELISKVLYPSDDHVEGKTLRLKQQYFLVSAALQDIVNVFVEKHGDFKNIPEYIAIHINDTHPALAIPELMRILMDDYHLSWDESWDIVLKTMSYTNHTVLVESLETWNEDLFNQILPRIYHIIKEINRRFCLDYVHSCENDCDMDSINKMAIITKNTIKMANLAIVASHHVNGVSKLHSDIIKHTIFSDFNNLYPNKFINITNGIAHRRWLCQSNNRLNDLLINNIGKGFYTDAKQLEKFKDFADDKTILNELSKIRLHNKKKFVEALFKQQGVMVDPNTRFDVQVKRIHEYKRQLLNVMKIIYLYEELLKNPDMPFTPQTFFFGGKAASRYYIAKRIIKLINQLGKDIDRHDEISKKLKVVFIENYNVTTAEKLIPASDVSEQISLAGKEASGTGNMKFMINGALTIGTFDGANVEISENCGLDNMFIFGLRVEDVNKVWKLGYNPKQYYNNNPKIKTIIDALNRGYNGESFSDVADYLINGSNISDPYMCIADFDSYLDAHYKMDELYKDTLNWNRKSLLNIANAGFFAGDRSIEEYVSKIWNLKKI